MTNKIITTKSKLIFFTVSITLILGNCSKDKLVDGQQQNFLTQQRSTLPSVIDIMDLLNEPVDGYISVTSYGTYSIQSLRGQETMCHAKLLDKSGKSSYFGDLSLNDVELPYTFNTQANTQNEYGGNFGLSGAPALFGDTIEVDVAGADTFPGLSVSFYSPPLITLESPAYQNNDTLSFDNLLVEWTSDPLNENGIGIMIHYDPSDPDNVGIGGSNVVLS